MQNVLKYFSKIKNIIIEKVEKEKKLKLIIPPDVTHLLNESTVKYGSFQVSLLPAIKFGASVDLTDIINKASTNEPLKKMAIANNKFFNAVYDISKAGKAGRAGSLGESIAAALLDGGENVNEFTAADNFPFSDVKDSNNRYYSVKFYSEPDPRKIKIQFNSFLTFHEELFERKILSKNSNGKFKDFDIGLIVISIGETPKKIIIHKYDLTVQDVIEKFINEFKNNLIITDKTFNKKNMKIIENFIDIIGQINKIIKNKSKIKFKFKDLNGFPSNIAPNQFFIDVGNAITQENLNTNNPNLPIIKNIFDNNTLDFINSGGRGKKPIAPTTEINKSKINFDQIKFNNFRDKFKTYKKSFLLPKKNTIGDIMKALFDDQKTINPDLATDASISNLVSWPSPETIDITLNDDADKKFSASEAENLGKGVKDLAADNKSASGAYRKVATDTADAIKSYIDDVRSNTNIEDANKDQEFKDRIDLVKNFNKIQKILKAAFKNAKNKDYDIKTNQIDKVAAAATYIDNLDNNNSNQDIEFANITT